MLKELYIYSYPVALSRFRLDESQDIDSAAIIACPDPPLEALKTGKAITVPRGEFEVDLILEQLPSEFYPDLVHLSAKNMSFFPKGLTRIKCPKVMKLGDTYHWGDGPLSAVVEYCKTLGCDYHWTYNGVQHLHFFVEAGLKNVFWLPGTLVIEYQIPQRSSSKLYDVCFRGSLTPIHVRRYTLLKFLQDAGVAIDIAQKPYLSSLEDYARSKVVFNCSGGGDLNRRVFEVLMAGGFLLTDRLSPQSGLHHLFQEGVHFECYSSSDELLEKIQYYLSNPNRSEEIALAGHQKLTTEYHPKIVKKKFCDFVFSGKIDPCFLPQVDKRSIFLMQDMKGLAKRIEVYELIQEIHRIHPEEINLLDWQVNDKNLLSTLADLPHLNLSCTTLPENHKEIELWCIQTGITNKVKLFELSVDPLKVKFFSIVLISLHSTSILNLKEILLESEKYLNDSGILILVSNSRETLRREVHGIAEGIGLVELESPESYSLLPKKSNFCLIYWKPSKVHKPNSLIPIIPTTRLPQKLIVKLQFLRQSCFKIALKAFLNKTKKFFNS